MLKLKYKEDNEKSDFQLKIIILSIVISLLIIPLFRNMLVTIFVLIALGIIIGFLSRSDGEIELYQEEEVLFLRITPRGERLSILEKIVTHSFSWNYNRLDDGAVGGRNITFIFLKLELITESGNEYVIGKELKQWQSLPKDWDYKALEEEKDHKMLITSQNMDKLKKQVEDAMT